MSEGGRELQKTMEGGRQRVIDLTGSGGGCSGSGGSLIPVSSSSLARPAFKASSNPGGGSFGGGRGSINFLRPASKAAEKLGGGGTTSSSVAPVLCCLSSVCQCFICFDDGGSSGGQLLRVHIRWWTSTVLTHLFKSIGGTYIFCVDL